MRINYLLQDIRIENIGDVNMLYSFLEKLNLEKKDMYMDEVVINLFINNESILKECLDVIKEYRFGILRRLPLVNMYFNINNVYIIKDLNNDIHNFITPILRIDLSVENVVETIKNVKCLFNQKYWKLQILLDVKNVEEFEQWIKLYNVLKCEFFEEDFNILFNFTHDKDLLECAYMNMNYVMDTIKFLGMRNNIIIECLLKAVREKETGICQEFNKSYKGIMERLMQFDIEKYYRKKTLVRETMDDFALV